MRHLLRLGILPLLLTCALPAQQQSSLSGVSNPPPEDLNIVSEPAHSYAKPTAAIVTEPAAKPNPTLVRRTEVAAPIAQPLMSSADTRMVDENAYNAAPSQPQSYPGIDPADMQMVSGDSVTLSPSRLMQKPGMVPAAQLPIGTRLPIVMTTDLASDTTQAGKVFRGKMSQDITYKGKVVIPKGSEVRGRVTAVQSGIGKDTMMRLRPDTVILPDGSRYQIHAVVSDASHENAYPGEEGEVVANSPTRHNAIVYSGAVGSGVIIGAVVAGPPGALVGAVVGAGAATTHVIFHHNRLSIPANSSLELALTEPMDMVPTIN